MTVEEQVLGRFWSWLNDNAEPTTAAAGIVQACGIVVAAIGAFLAAHSLDLTRTQVEDARKALRATTEFQIQKEGRALFRSMAPELIDYVYGSKPENQDLQRQAERPVRLFINYYASIFRQFKIEAVDRDFWEAVKREFCFFIKLDHVRPIWDRAVASGQYPDAFAEVAKGCKGP